MGNTHQLIRESQRGIAAQRQYYFVRHSFSEGGLGKREKCMDVFVLESKATILVPTKSGLRQALSGERAAFQLMLERKVSSLKSIGDN